MRSEGAQDCAGGRQRLADWPTDRVQARSRRVCHFWPQQQEHPFRRDWCAGEVDRGERSAIQVGRAEKALSRHSRMRLLREQHAAQPFPYHSSSLPPFTAAAGPPGVAARLGLAQGAPAVRVPGWMQRTRPALTAPAGCRARGGPEGREARPGRGQEGCSAARVPGSTRTAETEARPAGPAPRRRHFRALRGPAWGPRRVKAVVTDGLSAAAHPLGLHAWRCPRCWVDAAVGHRLGEQGDPRGQKKGLRGVGVGASWPLYVGGRKRGVQPWVEAVVQERWGAAQDWGGNVTVKQ